MEVTPEDETLGALEIVIPVDDKPLDLPPNLKLPADFSTSYEEHNDGTFTVTIQPAEDPDQPSSLKKQHPLLATKWAALPPLMHPYSQQLHLLTLQTRDPSWKQNGPDKSHQILCPPHPVPTMGLTWRACLPCLASPGLRIRQVLASVPCVSPTLPKVGSHAAQQLPCNGPKQLSLSWPSSSSCVHASLVHHSRPFALGNSTKM